MDWEAFEKHKAFAGEKKPSMLRRRVGHDYEQRCVYLVTMTVEGRKPLLGRLVGDAGAKEGNIDAPHIELSPLGKQVREMWEAISEYYPEVRVLATMVMPDHLHGILFVERQMSQPLGMVIKGFKAGCNKAYRQALAAGICPPMQQQCCSKENGKENDRTHGFLFSRNYNDHILEGEGELERWFRYLADNPRRLKYLLSYPEKAAVIVHSANSDEEFEEMKAQWLALAARGGVLISAAVATREKEVMREAMNRGYRLIALRENGFPPLYKPAGESFAACSQGTLLQVCPWEYHMNRRTISREQCLQLNRLAEWIAEQ